MKTYNTTQANNYIAKCQYSVICIISLLNI